MNASPVKPSSVCLSFGSKDDLRWIQNSKSRELNCIITSMSLGMPTKSNMNIMFHMKRAEALRDRVRRKLVETFS